MKKKISVILFAMLVSLTVSPALLADGRIALSGWRVMDRLEASIMTIYGNIRSDSPLPYCFVDAEQNQAAVVKQNWTLALRTQAQANVRTANKLVAAALANAADVALVGKKMAAEGITATVYTKGHSDLNAVGRNGRNPGAAETHARGTKANVQEGGAPVDFDQSAAKKRGGAAVHR